MNNLLIGVLIGGLLVIIAYLIYQLYTMKRGKNEAKQDIMDTCNNIISVYDDNTDILNRTGQYSEIQSQRTKQGTINRINIGVRQGIDKLEPSLEGSTTSNSRVINGLPY